MVAGLVVASSPLVLHLSIPTMIKSQSRKLQPITTTTLIKPKSRFLTQQTNPASFNPVICWKLYASMGSNNIPTPPPPKGSNSSLPAASIRCVIGVIVSLVQPFWKFFSGAKFTALVHQIEETVNMVEHVAEFVEEAAEAVEKESLEMAKKLPKDGFLKEVVTGVEHIAKDVADDAEDVIEFINRAEKVKEEIESTVEDVVEGTKCNPKDQMENALTMSQSISDIEEETKEKEDKIEKQIWWNKQCLHLINSE